MSQENVEIVRRAFAGSQEDGLEGLMLYLDPEIEWTTTGAFVEAATYRGHAGVRRYLGSMEEEFEDLSNRPEELIDAGDRVFVRSRISGRGKRSGAPAELLMHSVASEISSRRIGDCSTTQRAPAPLRVELATHTDANTARNARPPLRVVLPHRLDEGSGPTSPT